MFKSRRQQFFSDLLGDGSQTIGCPPLDPTLQFWKQLWGLPCEHDPTALLDLGDILKTFDIPIMQEPIIAPELFAYAVSRIKNWKSTGLDCLHGYWIKHLTSLHDHLRSLFNNLQGITLLKGRTTLLIKTSKWVHSLLTIDP